MARSVLALSALLSTAPVLLLAGPAAAQEEPPETIDCPEFSTPDEQGNCICDKGYELHEPTLTCVLEPCPENSARAPGRERDPRGCICLPGFKWEEAPEDHPDDVEFEPSQCVGKEACEEPGAVRDNADECICPENATGEFFTDDDGVVTLVSCECDEGYVFSPIFYTCRATDEQCPENSHYDEGIPAEGEGEGDVDGIMGQCRCDDGYVWTRGELGCTLIISDCGPNAHPSPQGEACECDEGFFPAPPGQPGCVGEELCGRCPSHAHPKGESEDGSEGEGEGPGNTCECECNTGYQGVFEGDKLVECFIEAPPCETADCGIGPSDDDEEGEEDTGGKNVDGGCFSSVSGAPAVTDAVLRALTRR